MLAILAKIVFFNTIQILCLFLSRLRGIFETEIAVIVLQVQERVK